MGAHACTSVCDLHDDMHDIMRYNDLFTQDECQEYLDKKALYYSELAQKIRNHVLPSDEVGYSRPFS